MPGCEEYNRNGLIDFDPHIPFPFRLVTLTVIGFLYYFGDYGFSMGGGFQ